MKIIIMYFSPASILDPNIPGKPSS